jgi:hypothetical protein
MKLSRELTSALDTARKVLDDRAKIEAAIRQAEAALPQAEAATQLAREALGQLEAEAALASEPVSTGQAQHALLDADLRVTTLHARVEGLTRKLSAQEPVILTALEQLSGGRANFNQQIVEELSGEYRQAAAELAKLLRKISAVVAGLGIHLLGFTEIQLPNLDGSRPAAWDPRPSKYREGQGRVGVNPWEGDPKAEALYADLSPICHVAKQLEKLAAGIREREEAAARAEAAKPAEVQQPQQELADRENAERYQSQERRPGMDSGPRPPVEEVQAGRQTIEKLAEGRL